MLKSWTSFRFQLVDRRSRFLLVNTETGVLVSSLSWNFSRDLDALKWLVDRKKFNIKHRRGASLNSKTWELNLIQAKRDDLGNPALIRCTGGARDNRDFAWAMSRRNSSHVVPKHSIEQDSSACTYIWNLALRRLPQVTIDYSSWQYVGWASSDES